MKAASIKEIKQELNNYSQKELIEFCLKLSKFKKENKELLSYLIYDAFDEQSYINDIKEEIDNEFKIINTTSYYFIKKSVRKILRNTKKYIRYSKKKKTEVELLLHFCIKMKALNPKIENNLSLTNIYNRQIQIIKKVISTLHEDLQYDFTEELKKL